MGLNLSVVTRSQRQDELVKMCPGGNAKVIRRPKTEPDGSDIVCLTSYEFPDIRCDKYIEHLCKVMKLGTETEVEQFQRVIRSFCGIEVDISSHKQKKGMGHQQRD